MEASDLKAKVIAAVFSKMDAREAFTTADISHPIIQEDSTVKHSDVRKIVDEMWNAGDIQNESYTHSGITVYPKPGKTSPARLFHPDEPGYDVNSYSAINQELTREQKQDAKSGQIADFGQVMAAITDALKSKTHGFVDITMKRTIPDEDLIEIAIKYRKCLEHQKKELAFLSDILMCSDGLPLGAMARSSVGGAIDDADTKCSKEIEMVDQILKKHGVGHKEQ